MDGVDAESTTRRGWIIIRYRGLFYLFSLLRTFPPVIIFAGKLRFKFLSAKRPRDSAVGMRPNNGQELSILRRPTRSALRETVIVRNRRGRRRR